MPKDVFGFDHESANKIARVVRDHLASSGGDKTHRRADVSGPGNHVAQAVITEMGGSVHKFRFVAGSFVEDIETSTAGYEEIPGEYYALDICRTPLQEGAYVWIVDHNNQWWIIDRCSKVGSGGGAAGSITGCCGMCGAGSITDCTACNGNAVAAYAFVIPAVEYEDDCCRLAVGNQFVYHVGSCGWEGIELDQCDGVPGTYPRWRLEITGTDPYDVKLELEMPGIENVIGGDDSKITYRNPQKFCCNCANVMRLDCAVALPSTCLDFPCEICILPGPKCCDTSDIATTLTATIDGTNDCMCADQLSIDLIYNAGDQTWTGQADFCQTKVTMKLQCQTDGGACGDFVLDVSWEDACYSPVKITNPDPCSCTPFSLTFQNIAADGCCGSASAGSTLDVVITL